MTKMIRALTTLDGRVVRVPGTKGWTAAARRAVCEAEVTRVVGAPVRFAPAGLAHAGSIKTVDGRPDVVARIMGGLVDREHRVSLHVTRAHHEWLVRHLADGGRAFQVAVAAVGPRQRGRPTLALVSFDYALIAAAVTRAFGERAIRRLNLTLAARWEDMGLMLRVPELGIALGHGVGELARVLAHAPGLDPSALLTTEERVAVVAAVLELRYGLRASAPPLEARTKVAHPCMHAVGLPDVPAHRLVGRVAPCARPHIATLERADLIGAPQTAHLFARPEQELTIVEVEHRTHDGVDKLRDRFHAAEALGLQVRAGLLVVRDGHEDRFRERLARSTAVVRSRTRIEPISRWYAEYCVLRDAHVAAQRALVRRAAA
ncbi:hypothetical protein J421_2303 [Gemmatirosa kalamazoonensis]|uniref:Uncharacterized protein n=1 Tax=Gemmatirosa kalamazoonensis TaxID=861299 RepID=W0RHN9_9BACT|nr:hypothetical protein [Gemmatirosa kalamazoonensis]AHG89840.1 hypothetical protein J421_2303 [Gemmatirosa kalamazoonensis]